MLGEKISAPGNAAKDKVRLGGKDLAPQGGELFLHTPAILKNAPSGLFHFGTPLPEHRPGSRQGHPVGVKGFGDHVKGRHHPGISQKIPQAHPRKTVGLGKGPHPHYGVPLPNVHRRGGKLFGICKLSVGFVQHYQSLFWKHPEKLLEDAGI